MDMDFRRTLKKRRPKKHVPVRVNVVTPAGDRPKSRGIKKGGFLVKSIEVTLIALFAGLAVVTQGQAEDYYFYEGPKGELVISNKEPPPGSKIIKRLPGVTDKETPQAQAQEPGKSQPNVQTEATPKPSKTK
jgi:hypothetical protein